MWRLLLLPTALALRDERLHADLDLEVERLGALTEFHRLIDEEKLSSTPLFYTEKEGRFATAAELLSQDPSSVLSRLENGFKTGSNMVVVGAGGAGKTETILLAMENAEKTKASFDLRSWYLAEKNLAKGDYDGSVKADQLSLLHSREAAIKEDIGGKSADVIFFDEVDLGDGYLNADELEAMKVLLKWGNEEAPSKAKVVVLHPLVSVQPEVHSLLSSLGFPVPGAATWIDFSQPYSDQVEEAMVRGILQACDPPATDAQIAEVKAYFLGLPSAYMPFLVNKNDVLNGLTGPAAAAIAGVVKPKAKAKVGGRLIMINVGIQASTEARTGIKALLSAGGELPKSGVEHMAGAIASMVVEARGGKYVIPPVMVEALTEYCDGANAKGKSIVAPICA